jgi:hypothetical protein
VEGPHVIRALALVGCAACAGSAAPVANGGVARSPVGGPRPAAPPNGGAVRSPSCLAPEFRQLDFWLGDWDVTVHARSSPTSDQWADAKGHQHVEAILGGCAIAEHFTADGPPAPWAGASYSMWQPKLGTWRQAWVDDSASFLAFQGGVEHDGFALYGEPKTVGGTQTQMRMVFLAITPTSLRWEWQQTRDGWATAAPQMVVDYRRSASVHP